MNDFLAFFLALNIYCLPVYLHALDVWLQGWAQRPTNARQTRMVRVEHNKWLMV